MREFWKVLGERGTITFYDRGWYTTAAEQALIEVSSNKPAVMKKLVKQAKNQPIAEIGAAKARHELHGDVVTAYQRVAHDFEQMLVDDGYVVVKLFVHVSKKAQRNRLESLRNNPKTCSRRARLYHISLPRAHETRAHASASLALLDSPAQGGTCGHLRSQLVRSRTRRTRRGLRLTGAMDARLRRDQLL